MLLQHNHQLLFLKHTQYEQPSPTETAQHEKDEKRREGGKETKKQERWSEEESKVLVSMYVEKHEELESLRCNQVWPLILKKVNQQHLKQNNSVE